MRLISYINGSAAKSLWIWKYLITWSEDGFKKPFTISYYPDYETPKWHIDIKVTK